MYRSFFEETRCQYLFSTQIHKGFLLVVQQCVAVCCSERYSFLDETRSKYILSTSGQVLIIMHKPESVSPDGVAA